MAEEINQTPEQAAPENQETMELEPVKQVPGMQTMWNNVKLMNQSFRMANMICKSGLVPDSYRNSPENCLIAIDIGNRMGMSPIMVMQNLYIVKGKPAWSGAFCAAVVNGSGRFTPLRYEWVGERGKPNFGCCAMANRLSDGALCMSDTVTMQMAQDEGWLNKPGSKWKTMPMQMMMYRAASFFAKAHCSDFLLGIPTIEEVQDVKGYDSADKKATVVTLDGNQQG